MAKTTITVNFAAADGTDTALLKLVLDSDSGSLAHNQMACVRMYRNPMTMEAQPSISHGRVTRQGLRRDQITETVTFANTDEAGLSCPASQIFSYQWIGRSLGGLRLATPETVTCDAAGCGAARITYETVYESLGVYVTRGLAGLSETDVVLCASAVDPDSGETVTAALALQFGDETGADSDDSDDSDSDDAETVVIRVVDYTTGDPVVGALVTIDGAARGRTKADGTLDVGTLASGEHSLVVGAAGYYGTGADELYNESFTL